MVGRGRGRPVGRPPKTPNKGWFKKGQNAHQPVANDESQSCDDYSNLDNFEGLVEDELPAVTTRSVENKRKAREQAEEEFAAEQSRLNEYIVAKIAHLELLFQSGWALMENHRATCPNKKLDLHKTEHRLISTSWCFICSGCGESTLPTKMYDEEEEDDVDEPTSSKKRGRKNSTLNTALVTNLLQLSIQGTQCAEFFLRLGVKPGSVSSINRKCITSGGVMVPLGEGCLRETRSQAIQRMIEEGESGVHCVGDSMYNNPISYDEGTPMPRGTVVTSSLLDARTGNYLDVDTQQFLCIVGARLIRDGKMPTCPDPTNTTHKCRATLSWRNDTLSDEARAVANHARNLKESGVPVSEYTTDGDCVVDSAIVVHFAEAKHTYDFQHASRNLTKQLKKVYIRKEAFPPPKQGQEEKGKGKKQEKRKKSAKKSPKNLAEKKSDKKPRKESAKERAQRLRKPFAVDIVQRINNEIFMHHHDLAKKSENGKVNPSDLAKSLRGVAEVAIKCVAGLNCGKNCKAKSKMCDGGADRDKAGYLSGPGKKKLNHTEFKQLRDLVFARKTSLAALKKSHVNASTQAVEGNNKALTKPCPKSTTHIATHKFRVYGHVLRKNLGRAGSTKLILKKIKHNISRDCIKELEKLDKLDRFRKYFQGTKKAKDRRHKRRLFMYQMHEVRKSEPVVYKKGIEINN